MEHSLSMLPVDAKDQKIAALEKEVAELKAKLASAGSLPGGTPQQPALLPALPAAGPPEPAEAMAMDRGDEVTVAVQQLTGGEPFRISIAATGTLGELKRLIHAHGDGVAHPDGQRLLGGATGTPLAEDEQAKLDSLGIGDGTVIHLSVQDAEAGRQRREARESERARAAAERRRLHEGFASPPRQANPQHPEGGNLFWRYADFCECLPCGHGACCYAVLCAPCAHGEIQEWAGGRDMSACFEWFLCWMCIPCMIEKDRVAIEGKILEFHRQRGDGTAPGGAPYSHEGVACIGIVCGGLAQWLMHAQNIYVMREFKEVQKEYLQAAGEKYAEEEHLHEEYAQELDGKTYLLQNVWDRPAETSALGNSKKFVGFTSDTLELQATHDMDQAMPIKFVAVPGKRHTYKLQNMYRPGDGRDRAHGNWVSFSWDGSWLYCRYEKESDAMPVLCKFVRPGIVKMKNCWDKGEHSKWISFTNDAAWLRAVYTEHDAVPLKLVAAPGC